MVAVVDVQGLRKAYGRVQAVDGVSFRVQEGEIFGLLGPNGSGKSTTVECVQGLRRPDAGRIEVLGQDVRADPHRVRRLIGSQLQDSALPDRIRVWEALHLFSAIGAGQRDWRPLLDDWGLAERRNAAFGDLSGGQRQRLFVALALICRPRLVVLDEMTTGLDPAARRVAWELVEEVRQRGATVLLVTHFMDEAERLCDRLAVLLDGRVVACGTAGALIAAVRPEAVLRFTAPPGLGCEFLRGVAGVERVEQTGAAVRVAGRGPILARVAHALVDKGIEPDDLRQEGAGLEDAYLALTDRGNGDRGRAGGGPR